MSFLDKAQTFLRRFRANEEPSEESMYSRRHDGSLSGYHPNVGRMSPSPEQAAPAETAYDPYAQPPSWAAQQEPAVGQTPVAQQSADMYGYGQQGYQPLWNQQPEQQTAWQQPQAEFQSAYQPQFQNPLANQPGSPFVGYQPQFQPQQPIQPVQQPQPAVPDNISYMPGAIVGKDGRQYLHTLRIAQITGVPDCYVLMQSMRNNETVVVNLDMVPDPAEIDRCLDLLFGASYALQCQFHHVSTRNIYLLTPATVQVESAENLRRRNEYEAENRWPDPSNLNYRPYAAYEPQNAYGAFGQNSYAASYQNVGGMGRRTGTRNTTVEYTDFGGFPNAGRF